MIAALKNSMHNAFAACLRVFLIFVVLTLAADSLTTMYYQYMPIRTWINFKSVRVKQIDGEATVIIDREPVGKHVAVIERVLLVFTPEMTRACSASTVALVDEANSGVLKIALQSALEQSCPYYIPNKWIRGKVQISYIFQFPRGVQRVATRQSDPFMLTRRDDQFVIGDMVSPAGK